VPLSDAEWTSLARDVRRMLDRAATQWTDTPAHDPGVTFVALFAFVAEELVYRSATLSEPARRVARDATRRAAALASALATDADDGGDGLQRVRYFSGQRLDADDFQAEQDYVLDRLARRNRLLHGVGIVDGLAVTIDTGAGSPTPRVVVAPGLAFDALGREIAVDAPWSAPLPAAGDALLVQLAYSERACGAVPVVQTDSGPDAVTPQATRIVETFAATLAPAPVGDAIAIARVHRSRGRWRVDPKFTPPRVRS